MINPVQAVNRDSSWRAAGLENAQHADAQNSARQVSVMPNQLYDVIRAGFGAIDGQLDQRYPSIASALQAAISEDELAPLMLMLTRAEQGLVSSLSVGDQRDVFRLLVEQASVSQLERLYLQLPEAQQRSRFGEVLANFASYDTRQAFLAEMASVLTTAPDTGDGEVLDLLARSLTLTGSG